MPPAAEHLANPVAFVGRTTFDALYWLDALPAEDTKIFAEAFRAAPGGPACNAAITHALLGGRPTLISAVGKGPWARAVLDVLNRHGVRLVDLAAGSDYETPLTTVLVSRTGASRTIVNPPQSAVQMRSLAGGWEPEWGDRPRLVLTDGFHLEEMFPLLRSCRTAGAAICLDGGSWKPGTEELAPLLTAAICSERFALPGCPPDPEATLAWFIAQGVPYVAVTRGAKPILGLDRGRRFEIEVERIEPVDTLGAGDVLHGAFCFFFSQDADFENALQKAAVIATRSCRALGIDCWSGEPEPPAP